MKINNIQDIALPLKGSAPTVFVTGCTGQDGSHMVDYLLKNTNHFIIGGARRLSVDNHENIQHLENNPRFQLVNFDLTDSHSMYKLMERAQPDYFINFAGQSFVAASWDFADLTLEANTKGVLNCLNAIRYVKPTCRFYNAGSSEEFGDVIYEPQDECHPLRARSPYGASKSSARHHIKVYRESYGMYAVQGWLFNHEGTRRGKDFVTRKITTGIARIINDIKTNPDNRIIPIELGNIDVKRDWSDAEDMVDAVWRMLNQEKYNEKLNKEHFEEWYELYNEEKNKKQMTEWESKRIKDYVVSSDINHSIREFVEEAFKAAGFVGGFWNGTGLNEEYVIVINNEHSIGYETVVKINPKFYRPADVNHLRGNSSCIRKELNWKPKVGFKELVVKMVKNDMGKI
jgi:GDPmannose 4,6-dehydratase